MASLMNGLSALGQGVSTFAGTAGLEAQKSALANQSAILADQLATTRETGLQQSAGQIAAAAATQQQGATAALQGQQQAFQAGQTTQTLAAEAARTAAEQSGATARTLAQINAPPDVIKVLRALHAIPDDSASAQPTNQSVGASGAASAPNASGGAAPPSGSPAAPSGGSASTAASASAASGSSSPMDNPLVRKALGYPVDGSEEAIRYAIAQDVKSDPNFKYKTAGEQGAEVQNRFEISSGKLMDPATRTANATAIASYQQPPITGRGLTAPGAAATMAEAMQINKDYQASRYDQVNKAMTAFGTGAQGDKVKALDTGVQHLGVLDQAADALNNGNIKAFAALGNQYNQQTGVAAPNTFDGLKQIVATEVVKSIAGGIGSDADRQELKDSLSRANSPAQLKSMIDGYRSLMTGQLVGLKQQYEQSTGFKSGPFAFETKLTPETLAALNPGNQASASAAATSPASATPKPPAIGDVQQGYTFSGGNPADPASWKAVK